MDGRPGAWSEGSARGRWRSGQSRSNLGAWLWLAVASVAAALVLSMIFVEPPPPRRIVIASGGQDGAYYQFAHDYARLLARDGLKVDVRETAGSVENLQLLGQEGSGVDVAIVQSGVATADQVSEFEALGSLYREPLWVFHRGDAPLSRLSELAGKRIGVGSTGSGTQAVARRLLEANGVRDGEAATQLIEQEVSDAADGLIAGTLDAAFFVAAFEAEYIQELLRSPSVHLAGFAQQEAYRRRFRFLAPVTIPAGVVDLGANLPDRDVPLLAPTAMLVVRPDFHPALIPLLLTAAQRIHGRGNVVTEPREFPAPYYCDLPVHDYARRFYTSGQPVLQKLLPFWLASLVDRAKLMIIPLVMLLMPLFRAAPPLIRWRTRRKVYRWYTALREIDQATAAPLPAAELERQRDRLKQLESQVAQVEVPLGYMKEFYHLRLHMALLHERLQPPREASA
jgi:TRAP transporter TAXI family solute receptor